MHRRLGMFALAAVLAAGLLPRPAQADGHLNVPVDQHVQMSFVVPSGGPINLYRLASIQYPDGSSVNDVPQGMRLVLTDLHVQIFRFGTDVSEPLDGFVQLGSHDVNNVLPGIQLTNVALEAAAGIRRTGTTHSFTAGFTFAGDRRPGVTALTDASVSDLHILASGYLIRVRR